MYDEIRNVKIQLESIQKQEGDDGVITILPSVAVDFQEVNVRAMMDAYYQGCGPRDIGKHNAITWLRGPSHYLK